jgi:hypothetical protein
MVMNDTVIWQKSTDIEEYAVTSVYLDDFKSINLCETAVRCHIHLETCVCVCVCFSPSPPSSIYCKVLVDRIISE